MKQPQVLRLTRRALDLTAFKGRHAREGDYSQLLTESTVVLDAKTGRVCLVYLCPIEESTHVLVDVLRHTDVPLQDRMSGMTSHWRTFGYRPRNAVRHPDCEVAGLAADDPGGHAVLTSFARVIAGYYAKHGPDMYAPHTAKAARVLPTWTLEGGPFTSGIVNRDAQLPYHHDAGNFRGVWSAMLGIKRDIVGGFLSVPEYDLAVEVGDKSLTFFDGQSLLHGVSPFKKTSPHAFRYTLVYYSLEGMWRCLPPRAEAVRRTLRVVRQKPGQA